MANLGKWDTWYAGLSEPEPYGDVMSYRLAAEWLASCASIADWGCGKGAFRGFVDADRYVGFDGSSTPFADRVVDLTDFRYASDGILLRHVIEHDYEWRKILHNAAASFARRMMVVVFTPMLTSSELEVREIGWQELGPGGGVPDLSFSMPAIVDTVGSELFSGSEAIESATQYRCETLFRFER